MCVNPRDRDCMTRTSESRTLLSVIGRRPGVISLAAVLCSAAAWGATFGTVVHVDIPNGGHVSGIVLDEPRGALYIANFTGKRIDVMSLADKKVTRSITVPAQPSAMALSPDGTLLVVTHFGADPGFPLFPPPTGACPTSGVSVVSLGSGSVQSFCFGDTPLGVAFGNDDRALIVTTAGLLSFNPLS